MTEAVSGQRHQRQATFWTIEPIQGRGIWPSVRSRLPKLPPIPILNVSCVSTAPEITAQTADQPAMAPRSTDPIKRTLTNAKRPRISARPSQIFERGDQLLDLAFFVFNMLTNNWIVLTHNHLFSHRAGVFLGYVKMASPRSGVQADFDGGRLRHVSSLSWVRPRNAHST